MADDTAAPAGEDAVMTRARKRFQQAVEAEDENRGKQRDDMRFLAATPDDNFQWPEEILATRQNKLQDGGARPCLTINKMRSHQNQVLNEQRMNRPQITARPGDSKASKEVAKALNGWLRHIQVASEADLAYDQACLWQTGAGEGFFRIFAQFDDAMGFDQEVVFAPLPDRFKVYLDPIGLRLHPAGKKCRWGFIAEDLPKDEYDAIYGEESEIDWPLAGSGDMQHWFPSGRDVVRVAEYFEIEETKKTICLWEDGGVTVKGSPEESRYARQRPVRERETKIPRCIWRRMNGQKVLGKPKEMPTKYVPIVRVVGNEFVIDGKVMVDGMVRPAKDAQRMYNVNASVEIELNGLMPKAPITAMVEQIKGHEELYRTANTVAHAYLPYNGVYNEQTGELIAMQPPQRMQPAMPQAAILQAKIGADQDIKATMGQWGPALGEPSGEKSGKAINARKVESDVGTFHYTDNLARALRYAGCIAIDMAAEVIDSRRAVRILGEDGEPDHIVVDPELKVPYEEQVGADGKKVKVYNFALGKYEVVVNTGPSFTTKRAEAAEFLTSAVQSAKDPASANALTYLAMKNQDWAGAEEATTMLKKLLPPQLVEPEDGAEPEPVVPTPNGPVPLSQAGQLIAQLMQQLQQASGQLQKAGDIAAAEQDVRFKTGEIAAREATLRLREQLIGKTLEAEGAKDDAERTQVIADVKLVVERALGKLEASKQIPPTEPDRAQEAAAIAERNAGIEAQQNDLKNMLAQALQLLSAPRRVELLRGEDGRPSGAVSAPVM